MFQSWIAYLLRYTESGLGSLMLTVISVKLSVSMFGSSWRGSSTKIHVFQCVEYRFTDTGKYIYACTAKLHFYACTCNERFLKIYYRFAITQIEFLGPLKYNSL